MSKSFIAAIAATAIAVTSFTAAPAHADLTDFEKFLLGAGALIIIGTVAEEVNNSNTKKKVVRQHPKPHRPKPKAHRNKPLPGYCLRNVRSYEGPRRIFGNRCLQNNYRDVNRLPKRCKVWVEGPRGTRVGYRPRCLRNKGFRVAH